MKKILFLLVFLAVFLSGCAGVETEVYTVFEDDYWQRVEPIIRSGNLSIGMQEEEVLLIMDTPDILNKQYTILGLQEEWIYKPEKYLEDAELWVYLYFEKGILTTIQRPNNF